MPGLLGKIKRTGTTPHKFQFTICVKEISFSKSILEVCETDKRISFVYVWKRGPRSAISKPKTCEEPASFKFHGLADQQLNLMCTLYQDPKKGTFSEKTSTITIRTAAKEIGVATIDLAKFANAQNGVDDDAELKKCKDKHATLKFSLYSKLISGENHESASIVEADDDEESEMPEESKLMDQQKESPVASKSASPVKIQDSASSTNNNVAAPRKKQNSETSATPKSAPPEPESKKDETKVAMLEQEIEKLKRQCGRYKSDLERMQVVLGDWEIKLVNLKVELVNTVDSMNNLEVENMHLKESLANSKKK